MGIASREMETLEKHITEMLTRGRECQVILKSLAERPTQGKGRKPLGVPVKNIYDALHQSSSVIEAARELRVSRAYIYDRVPEPKKHLKGVFHDSHAEDREEDPGKHKCTNKIINNDIPSYPYGK